MQEVGFTTVPRRCFDVVRLINERDCKPSEGFLNDAARPSRDGHRGYDHVAGVEEILKFHNTERNLLQCADNRELRCRSDDTELSQHAKRLELPSDLVPQRVGRGR